MKKGKQAYSYDPKTGQYRGATVAFIDPLESEKKKKAIYLCPANATFKAPPKSGAGEVVIFDPEAGKWKVDKAPPEPASDRERGPEEERERLADRARRRRDHYLSKTDFTALTDAPEYIVKKAAEWQAFRQALRDLPDQPGFPQNIEWPEAPGTIRG